MPGCSPSPQMERRFIQRVSFFRLSGRSLSSLLERQSASSAKQRFTRAAALKYRPHSSRWGQHLGGSSQRIRTSGSVGGARLPNDQGFLRSNWHVLPNVVARPKNAPSRNPSRTTARRVLRRSDVLSRDLSAPPSTSAVVREPRPPTKASLKSDWITAAFVRYS